MRPTKALLLSLSTALAAASIAVGAAQACGPMGGESGGSGSLNSGAAERMRQGADDAAGGNTEDEGDGRRSSGVNGGGASQDLSRQISALGAAEASDEGAQPVEAAQPQESYDGHTDAGNNVWWTMLTGDSGLEHSLIDNQPPVDDPNWKAQMDKPWYQRLWEAVQVLAPSEADPPSPTGGWNGWWAEPTGGNQLDRSLLDKLPPAPAYENPDINPAWRTWNDLPWYQKWTTTEPPHNRPTGAPRQGTPPYAGVRG